MRVLFCTTGGLGHLLPLRPLALALRGQGHKVAWVTAPDACPALQGSGIDHFEAGPTFEASRHELRTVHGGAMRLTGESLSAYTFPRLFGAVLGPAMLAGIEQAVRSWRPDFVVGEPAALAVPLVCQQLGLRHVTHGYGLQPPQAYIEDAMDFFGPFWRARGLEAPADGGLSRHLALSIAPLSLQSSAGPTDSLVFRFNAYRPGLGLPPALPAELLEALQRRPARRPRIYVTFGTVFNRSPALFVAAQAAARLGGTVVVTTGPDGDLPGLAQLGAHVHVHRFVDQGALLPHCDAVVSHGGAGAMLGAAAHGLPHLVLPQAADHFRNARALSRVGAGRSVELERQSEEVVSTELSMLLDDGALGAGARLLAQQMAAMADAAAAVRMLERWHSCAPLASR